MRRHNRYLVYEKIKSGNLTENLRKELESYGLLRDYESFEELQEAILEHLKSHKTTRGKLQKFKKYIKENPLDAPFSSTSPALRYLAEKAKVNQGDLVAFLRAHAFKNVPATKRYIRARRYENPITVYLFLNGGRKKRRSLKDKFTEDDVASAILDGEVAIYSGDYKKYYYSLRVAEAKLEHDGPYALQEPPDDIKGVFEYGERHVGGKSVRRLMISPKDSDTIVLIR